MLKDIVDKLLSEDKFQIQKGLEALADKLPALEGDAFDEAIQAVTGLFYVDPMDHPELIPVLEQAEYLLADLRERAIPSILRFLGESDLKTHFHLAAVLGKMGYAAVGPLLEEYGRTGDDYARVFILYALGKVKDPKVLDALPALFDALEDPNPEIRDTAARALGKICEHVNPSLISEETRARLFDKLMARVSDRMAGVRSKAVRSLGKMARFGLLDRPRADKLRSTLAGILGETEGENWDVAYIVRAEAQKARAYV
ncbi:MAG: hypothetical protein Kow0092_34220 [Deferrisomatales bacterium]